MCCGNGNNLYFVIMFLFSSRAGPGWASVEHTGVHKMLYCKYIGLKLYYVNLCALAITLGVSVSWSELGGENSGELIGSLYAIQSIIPVKYEFSFSLFFVQI